MIEVESDSTTQMVPDARVRVTLAAPVAIFAVFFLFFTGIAETLGEFAPPLRQRLFALGAAVGIAIALLAWFAPAVLVYERRSPLLRRLLVGATLIVFGYTIASNWLFNLDDKWVYYRTSLNALRYGLPYWNPEDSLNINSSFLWPYLTAPGHLVGGWDLFGRLIGVASVALTGVLAWRTLSDRSLRVVAVAGVLLYYPLVLWSMGGLETAFATLYLCVAAYLLVRGPLRPLPWMLLGGVFLIRPDTVLIGGAAWVVIALLERAGWRAKLRAGVAFAAPVVAFLVMNQLVFGRLLPSPFYVKGWNKAFSGHYPLHVDIQVGLTHLASGLSVSILLTGVLVLTAIAAIRSRAARTPVFVALAVGALVHLGYVVVGGYQHMNFAFRYYVPSLIPLFYVAVLWLDRIGGAAFGELQWHRTASALVCVSLAVQAPLAGFVAYYGRNRDVALTRSELRDHFSVASYAGFMEEWLKAGPFMKEVARPGERVFLYQDLAAAAMADIYTLDQFYAPMQTSSDPQVRACPTTASSQETCFSHFTYIFSFADEKFTTSFPNHEVFKKYSNLWILRLRPSSALE